MDLGLGGKNVVITGGSRGIGLACARVFAAEGARVVIAARDGAALTTAATKVADETGGSVLPVVCDITSTADVQALMRRAGEDGGGPDILVNNAGAALPQPWDEFSDAHWAEAMNYKLIGYLRCTMAAVPSMAERGEGCVVNIAGSSGREPNPWSTSSSAVNAALLNCTKTLAARYAPDGVRVNAISPGPIETERWRTIAAREPDRTRRQVAEIPLGRLGRPDDIANLVAFLSSDLSGFTTGISVTVDGGRGASTVY